MDVEAVTAILRRLPYVQMIDPVAETIKINDLLKHSWRMGCFVADPYEAVITKARKDRGDGIREGLNKSTDSAVKR